MNVNAIRERIMELSHLATGDEEMRIKALGWLNAAYHELMDEVVGYLPLALQRLEDVSTDLDGRALLSATPYRVLKVVNRDSGSVMDLTTLARILDLDPSGTSSGDPLRCVCNAGEISVHPKGVARLSVLYVPEVADLLDGGEENSILLPRVYHHALVWGGMVWSSLFERGFSSQSELLVYQRNWLEAKERIRLSMLASSHTLVRVSPFNLI